ncbi:MAG: protein-tyrosine-phosphatase [Pseudonocardia sp.]|nr:protein-tyrosine-phosphatase [Pseudonocardia sp.]MDT7699707.1 protein-tyrosine phosphatase [Pseudonocardiales bacterium]
MTGVTDAGTEADLSDDSLADAALHEAAANRWLTLEGLSNLRDVGGLPLKGGGTTRTGVLFRSEALNHMTPADIRHMVDVVGLKLVLDLRTDREVAEFASTAVAEAGVEIAQFSFIPEEGRELPEIGEDSDPMVANYLGYLRDRGPNVLGAVRRLAAEDAGPALVHCAAGKDRTGTLVAMVLDAVGVEREAIIEDYALSATRIEDMFTRWRARTGEPVPDADELDRHRPRARAMEEVLAVLDERDDGAAGWLRANGLTGNELATLRARFTGA